MKRLIYKVKRFLHSLKVRRRIKKYPKFMRKFAFHFLMMNYDLAQTLKGIKPMTGETLDRMARTVGIERQTGETDDQLRKRVFDAIGRKSVETA